MEKTRIYAIGGGKGGAGKSFVTASIGAFLTRGNKRVVLVDLDLGASNLHTIIGLPPPREGLHLFLQKKTSQLKKVITPTAVPHLYLISSARCSMEIANLYHQQKIKIIRAIQQIKADYVLIDLGAGTHFNTLDFFMASDNGILLFTPEPTSIENTIRFIRAVTLRRLKQMVKQHDFHAIVRDALDQASRGELNSPDILERVIRYDPEKKALLEAHLNRFQFHLILNQVRKTTDPAVGPNLALVCNRHFYSPFHYLGHVNHDERIHDSINSRTLYVHKYPYTPSAGDLKLLAERLMTGGADVCQPMADAS